MFESVLNQSRNTVLALAPESADGARRWRVLLANPLCEESLGLPLREIENAEIGAVIPAGACGEITALLERALGGSNERMQVRLGEGEDARWMMADAIEFAGNVALVMADVTPMT